MENVGVFLLLSKRRECFNKSKKAGRGSQTRRTLNPSGVIKKRKQNGAGAGEIPAKEKDRARIQFTCKLCDVRCSKEAVATLRIRLFQNSGTRGEVRVEADTFPFFRKNSKKGSNARKEFEILNTKE